MPVCVLLAACAAPEERLEGDRLPLLALEASSVEQEETTLPAGARIDLPPPRRNADWPQEGGSASHTLPHPAFSGTGGDRVFTAAAGRMASAEIGASPVAGGGRIFVLDGRARIRAFDAKTGAAIWRRALTVGGENTAPAFGGGLALDGDTLYVATGLGTCAALDAESGKVRWRYNTGRPFRSAPIAGSGLIFFMSHDNRMAARDAETGLEVWHHQGIAEQTILLNAASPAIAGNLLIAPYSSGEIFALRVESGAFIWSSSLRRSQAALIAEVANQASPVVQGDHIIATGSSGHITAFAQRNGQPVWSQNVASASRPAVAGNYVFAISRAGFAVCLDNITGDILWAVNLNKDTPDNTPIWHGPLLAGGHLYMTSSQGDLLRLNARNGTISSRRKVADAFDSPPVIAGETLYLLTRSMNLIALR